MGLLSNLCRCLFREDYPRPQQGEIISMFVASRSAPAIWIAMWGFITSFEKLVGASYERPCSSPFKKKKKRGRGSFCSLHIVFQPQNRIYVLLRSTFKKSMKTVIQIDLAGSWVTATGLLFPFGLKRFAAYPSRFFSQEWTEEPTCISSGTVQTKTRKKTTQFPVAMTQLLNYF